MLTLLALAMTPAAVSAAEFYLRAGATTQTMPGGTVVAFWGFEQTDAAFNPLPGEVIRIPGPRLMVPPGDATVTIHLYNGLPASAGAETTNISLVIPNQLGSADPTWTDGTTGPRGSDLSKRVRSFTHETAPGSSSDYVWTGFKPGTFLYMSGTHPQVQVQMGLYGCITADAAPGQAYPGVVYDNEGVLLFSEVDPDLHAAVAGGTYGTPPGPTSTIGYHPRFFLINGEAYPDTLSQQVLSASPAAVGSHVLLRFLNAGLETHVPIVQGQYLSQVSDDGNPLPYARQVYSVDLQAGKTVDALMVPDTGGLIPVYDRRLRLTNDTASAGGMLTYLNVFKDISACPGAVGSSFMLTKSGGDILFTWTDISGATSYRVYTSTLASDPYFPQEAMTTPLAASTGATGETLPIPPDNLVFYLVAGANSTGGFCEGPKR